jgi:DNA replication and repair protein RecF
LSELVRHGQDVASASATFVESDPALAPRPREQVAALQGRTVVVHLDGQRPASLGLYATRSPVVAFHAGELALSAGPATGRRTLLDRLALFLRPTSADHRLRYARALRARQQLLHGGRGADQASAIEAFEALCAQHGAALTRAREAAAAALEGELLPAFRAIAAPEVSLLVRFRRGGSADPAEAAAELARRRSGDAVRPSAGFGPHRDDLELLLDGHPVRLVASQGQHRAITLALKVAESMAIADARGLTPIFLLDDISSELDPERTAALFRFLAETPGQVFLTTTRPELIVTPTLAAGARRDYRIEEGAIQPD